MIREPTNLELDKKDGLIKQSKMFKEINSYNVSIKFKILNINFILFIFSILKWMH